MDKFKNPFDELEVDSMINLETIPEPEINSNIQQSYENNNKKQMINNQEKEISSQKFQDVNIDKLEEIIQNQKFNAQQTIFLGKEDLFDHKNNLELSNEEPPLLEDIGIDLKLTIDKIISIVKFQKPLDRYIESPDLFGPLVIGLSFGILLFLSGKTHFSDIYFMYINGNLFIWILFNLMSQVILLITQIQLIPLYSIMSSLGYCLLPLLGLGFFGVVFSLKNILGVISSLTLALWCAFAASNYIQRQMHAIGQNKKGLLFYPLCLYYVCFAMITIF